MPFVRRSRRRYKVWWASDAYDDQVAPDAVAWVNQADVDATSIKIYWADINGDSETVALQVST